MLAKTLRLLLGVLLIPVLMGYARAFAQMLFAIQQIRTPEMVFLLGMTGYLAFHVLVASPSRAYVFGHELTHAVAAWVSGGKVKSFKVGANKGSVVTNKISAFIALSPYLIPVYAVLWAFGYGLAGLFWNMKPYGNLFFFGLGATLTFHLVFTVNVLKEKQSDLDFLGPVLALAVIAWANVTLVAAVLSLVVPEVRFLSYFTGGFQEACALYRGIFLQLFSK